MEVSNLSWEEESQQLEGDASQQLSCDHMEEQGG